MLYAIGDIHGCLDQLLDRLEAIHADAGRLGIAQPRVVFLGDYVDRGSDSKGVLDILTGTDGSSRPTGLTGSIMAEIDPRFCLGNHDFFFLAAVTHELNAGDLRVWLTKHGGAETLESYGADLRRHGPDDFLRRVDDWLPPAHLEFLANLEPYHRFDELLFTHAGVNPEKSLDEQPLDALLYGDSRMFDFDHDRLAPQLRQRLGARVVHGHWANYGQVEIWPHRVNVDTGAGYAGCGLTAVAIEGEDVRVLA
jgi:serine/threonine protein phosphatase 1